MAKWEAEIQKKLLQAVPFKVQSNWDKMSAMLDIEGPVAEKQKKSKGFLWLSFGLAFISLLGLSLLKPFDRSDLYLKATPQIKTAPVIKTAPPITTVQSTGTIPAATNPSQSPAQQQSIQSNPQQLLVRKAIIKDQSMVIENDYSLQGLEKTKLADKSAHSRAKQRGPDRIKKALSPLGLSTKVSMPRSADLQHNPDYIMRLWKLGFSMGYGHLAITKTNGLSRNYELFPFSFLSLSLEKKLYRKTSLTLRADYDDLWFSVKETATAQSDLFGNTIQLESSLKRYLRKKSRARFRPYAGLGLGLQWMNLNQINVQSPLPGPESLLADIQKRPFATTASKIRSYEAFLISEQAQNYAADIQSFGQLNVALSLSLEFEIHLSHTLVLSFASRNQMMVALQQWGNRRDINPFPFTSRQQIGLHYMF